MISKRKLLAITGCIVPAVVLVACAGGAVHEASPSMHLIEQGRHSGIRFERMEVIRSDTALQNLWAAHFAPAMPSEPVPDVDFQHDMVIAVYLGQYRTGGYSVTVTSVHKSAAGIEVGVQRTSPGPGCRRTQMLTQPFVMVKVPRIEGPAHFAMTDKTTPCKEQ